MTNFTFAASAACVAIYSLRVLAQGGLQPTNGKQVALRCLCRRHGRHRRCRHPSGRINACQKPEGNMPRLWKTCGGSVGEVWEKCGQISAGAGITDVTPPSGWLLHRSGGDAKRDRSHHHSAVQRRTAQQTPCSCTRPPGVSPVGRLGLCRALARLAGPSCVGWRAVSGGKCQRAGTPKGDQVPGGKMPAGFTSLGRGACLAGNGP